MAENDTSPDADLQLKKRARRRLVGATALALLAVIVLPMVMDREPKPPVQDIQVRIPNQDATGLAAKMLPNKATATPMPAPEPKPEAKAEAAAAADSPQAAAAQSAPAAKGADPAPAATKPAEPAAKPAAAPAPAAKSEPAPKAAAKAVAAPASESAAAWIVQLGAYKEAGNVKVLLAKLKGMGLPAYTENFDSAQGPRTRVRAGPFASKEAAEKARVRIKTIGVDGSVGQK